MGVMDTKLNWPLAILLGVLVAGALALIGDLPIVEFAVASNALTIVP
jgi:hypothetical protein